MACVTEVYGYAVARSNGIRLPLSLKGFTRVAVFTAMGLLACSWMMTALGTLETVVPAFAPVAPVMRRVSLTAPQALAVVDHRLAPSRRIRQGFIDSYTADTAYSNIDWHRNKDAGDAPIIADIGPDSVIEDKPVDPASLIELRADRVRREEPVMVSVNQETVTSASSGIEPLSRAEEADTVEKQVDLQTGNAFLLDDVPLPGVKPSQHRSRMHERTELAYAPESGATEEPRSGLFSSLLNRASHSKVAIYDIAAATVYLPSGERLEAHSGLGSMRDNPRYVNRKNRGPTPPNTYNLRMREALFHGVEAIRLTPVDGKNRYNRDGLLAHTFMLGRRGDSNGCVVFKDYPRFLRAFKRGEFNKLVVVPRMQSSKPARIASLF